MADQTMNIDDASPQLGRDDLVTMVQAVVG